MLEDAHFYHSLRSQRATKLWLTYKSLHLGRIALVSGNSLHLRSQWKICCQFFFQRNYLKSESILARSSGRKKRSLFGGFGKGDSFKKEWRAHRKFRQDSPWATKLWLDFLIIPKTQFRRRTFLWTEPETLNFKNSWKGMRLNQLRKAIRKWNGLAVLPA